MKVLKKFFSLLLVIGVMFSFSTIANATELIPEKTLDKFLEKANFPEKIINEWEYSQKLNLYEKAKNGGKVEFDRCEKKEFYIDEGTGKLVEKTSKPIIKSGRIPDSALVVSHTFATTYSDGEKYKTIYANYEWKTYTYDSIFGKGTNGDKIAIVLPKGWEIRSDSYDGKEFQSGWPANGWGATGDFDGGTYDISRYGAVWSATGTDKVWHKGWVSLDATKVDSSASNRVISKYVRDVGSASSWSIGWGPLSVSIDSDQDSDQKSWDSNFSY